MLKRCKKQLDSTQMKCDNCVNERCFGIPKCLKTEVNFVCRKCCGFIRNCEDDKVATLEGDVMEKVT